MRRRNETYVWVTWITGLLAAELHCEFAAWFKSNYKDIEKIERDQNNAQWTATHGERVKAVAEHYTALGYRVFVENQNKFNLKGRTATLGGVPDIVAIKDDDVVVIDVKTGKPKDRDVFQVMIYMLVLPKTHSACIGRQVRGIVDYGARELTLTSDDLPQFVPTFSKMMERMSQESAPAVTPSYQECRFCDIATCEDRVKEPDDTVTDEEFF